MAKAFKRRCTEVMVHDFSGDTMKMLPVCEMKQCVNPRATNCHLYHYAGNNPVRYVDTDGEKIRIWFFNQESKLFRYGRYYIWDNESDCFINSYGNKITGNSFVDEITACIKYLKQSSLAKSMIDKLDKSDRFVTIKKSGIRTDAYTKKKE